MASFQVTLSCPIVHSDIAFISLIMYERNLLFSAVASSGIVFADRPLVDQLLLLILA